MPITAENVDHYCPNDAVIVTPDAEHPASELLLLRLRVDRLA
jgi:hypothetical protein